MTYMQVVGGVAVYLLLLNVVIIIILRGSHIIKLVFDGTLSLTRSTIFHDTQRWRECRNNSCIAINYQHSLMGARMVWKRLFVHVNCSLCMANNKLYHNLEP